jgi:hypothetical protein
MFENESDCSRSYEFSICRVAANYGRDQLL